MLRPDEPARFISILYRKMEGYPVRVHLHTDDNSIWLVGKDVCRALHITNPSYVATRLPKEDKHKHCLVTTKGTQPVMWYSLHGARLLTTLAKSIDGRDFYAWLEEKIIPMCKVLNSDSLPDNLKQITAGGYSFKDPVVIERDTLDKLLEVARELNIQSSDI